MSIMARSIVHSLATLLLLHATVFLVLNNVNGQISTPCTSSMITSFTPCINFVTGSSSNGASPSSSCCKSLKSIMSTSVDCACLIVTASVPLQLPINRTLAISLPQACNAGVPLQCKATGTPLPPPGSVPILLTPTPAPAPADAASASAPLSPQAVGTAAPPPESQVTLPLAPTYPPEESEAPAAPAATTTTSRGTSRPVVTTSASPLPRVTPPPLFLIFVAILVFKNYLY